MHAAVDVATGGIGHCRWRHAARVFAWRRQCFGAPRPDLTALVRSDPAVQKKCWVRHRHEPHVHEALIHNSFLFLFIFYSDFILPHAAQSISELNQDAF
jgi:hypothetical protein